MKLATKCTIFQLPRHLDFMGVIKYGLFFLHKVPLHMSNIFFNFTIMILLTIVGRSWEDK
jgi:hypothetical protein